MNTNQAIAEATGKAMTEEEAKNAEDAKNKIKIIDKTTEAQKLVFEKDFHFTYTDDSGKVFEGDFLIKKMSLTAIGKVGVIKARLNGGMNVEPHIDMLHQWMAQCQVSMLKAPDWFNFDKMQDMHLLGRIHDEVVKFENSFRRLA